MKKMLLFTRSLTLAVKLRKKVSQKIVSENEKNWLT
jgi:hypothetical protein